MAIIDIPRVLLIALGAPDAPYKVIPKIVESFVGEKLLWCSFWRAKPGASFSCQHLALNPKSLHWRLRKTAANHFYTHECQTGELVQRILDAADRFRPEMVWVVPELGAARLGYEVARKLAKPLHLTLHDAVETAADLVPRLYYRFYCHSFRKLVARCDTVDSISEELLIHERRQWKELRPVRTMIFPPSVPNDWMLAPCTGPARFSSGPRRRIGLCGSMRITSEQWKQFVALLGRLNYEFEFIAIAYEDMFHNVPLPANVIITKIGFLPQENAVIKTLRDYNVDACYLGLWKDKKHLLFSQTSLSAKLTTYLAAGVPVIVDGPQDSPAWQIVGRYGAGLLCDSTSGSASDQMERLMSDESVWSRMANGSALACREAFDLELHCGALARLFCENVAAWKTKHASG